MTEKFCEYCDRTEEDGEDINECGFCETMFCDYHNAIDANDEVMCPHCGATRQYDKEDWVQGE